MAMGLIKQSDLTKGTKQLTSIGTNLIAPAVGGIAGFMNPDFIGVKALISEVMTSTGLFEALPVIGSLDITSFITAAAYAGLAVVISRISFGGWVFKTMFVGLTWFFGASALRNAIDGLTGGIKSIGTLASGV